MLSHWWKSTFVAVTLFILTIHCFELCLTLQILLCQCGCISVKIYFFIALWILYFFFLKEMVAILKGSFILGSTLCFGLKHCVLIRHALHQFECNLLNLEKEAFFLYIRCQESQHFQYLRTVHLHSATNARRDEKIP